MPIGKFNLTIGSAVRPTRQNLLRLCLIRNILVAILLAIMLWLWLDGTVSLSWLPLLVVFLVMIVINMLVIRRLRTQRPVSEYEFFSNLLIDVVFLTMVLYLSGGSTNPIVSYYLIPLIISAAVLRPLFTWFIACLCIVLYTLLLFYYQPFSMFTMSGHSAMTNAHFIGMWVNFCLSALLISWFVVRMASTLREQAQAIANSREAGLRDEQIISIASIAAGTAHEMRTPLSTMTVTVDEISDEHPELREEMAVLQQQIDRCDGVLQELVSKTTEDSYMVVTDIASLLHGLKEKWALARPEVSLQTEFPTSLVRLRIRYDQSLQHALMSFLNNAADASPEHVALQLEADQDSALFIIEDKGAGIPLKIIDQLGKTSISDKQQGRGLGVLLSQASIERLGGEVTLSTGSEGVGTRLIVRYPLVVENS